MKSVRRLFGAAALAAACTVALASSAFAENGKIVLRAADSLPIGHVFTEYALKYWMDGVTRQTNGAVAFEHYPAEQLGKAKDMLTLTRTGVTDIGYVATSYVSDKMPLSAVAELPGAFTTSCEGSEAYWSLASDGILAEKEFAPNEVVPLFIFVVPPYQIFSVKRRIDTVSALSGMKLRTSGGAQDLSVRKMGGVPVRMTGPEIYESLSRGTMDGLIWPYLSVIPYNTQNLIRYATVGQNFGSFVGTYLISTKNWNRLPPKVREVMREVGNATTRHTCAMLDKDVQPTIEKLKGFGIEMIRWSDEEQRKVDALMASVGVEWAAALDRQGRPGTETLKAFTAALKRVSGKP